MSIILSLIAGLTADQTNLQVTGSESHVIHNSEEAREFRIDQNLYRTRFVQLYTGYYKPAGTYIRDYQPWNGYNNKWHLYEKYGWQEVTVSIQNTKVTMLDRDVSTELIVEDILDNTTNRPQKMTPRASRSIENIFSIKWSQERSLATTLGIDFTLGFNKLGSNISANYSFTDTYSFGKEESKSTSVKYSTESGGIFDVPANTCTKVSMYGKHAKIKAEIEYQASLSGSMAANYNFPFFGHYFWAYDIRAVLNSAGLPSTKTIKQVMTTSYVFNTYLKIADLTKAECDIYRKGRK